jgi:hypothetical protein
MPTPPIVRSRAHCVGVLALNGATPRWRAGSAGRLALFAAAAFTLLACSDSRRGSAEPSIDDGRNSPAIGAASPTDAGSIEPMSGSAADAASVGRTPADAGMAVASQRDGGPAAVSPTQMVGPCDSDRPGFKYKGSRGPRAEPLPAATGELAPIPCQYLTDYGAAEPSIVVTKDGSVLFAPVFTKDGAGVIATRDNGEHWEVRLPKLDNGGTHGRVQPYMARDPETDRVIFATNATVGRQSPELLGFNLSISDDAGKTWSASHLPIDANDWVKIFTGKPRSASTKGYPNVVYASAPNPISTPVPYASLVGVKPDHQSIYRSLDGGKTWEAAGRVSLLPSEVPGCDPNEWLIFGSGTTTPDGSAHQVMRRCTKLALATSRDDGKTWTVGEIAGSSLPGFDTRSLTGIISNPNVLATELLTSDDAGNLYVVYVDAQGSLRLQISRDGGATFSTPVTVQAPNVNAVVYGAVAAKEPGTLAIGYYGSTDHGVNYHGYIAETEDAFSAAPTFASVTVNPESAPLFRWGFEVGYLGILELADLNEIVQVKYAPNGDIWGSFTKDHCDGTAHYGTCDWDLALHENSGMEGVVGRFVHGQAPAYAGAPAAAAPPGPGTCQYDNLPSAAACMARLDQASDKGVCAELGSCVCNKCRCEVYNCDADPKCTAVLVCAAKNNCRGQECLVLCPDEVKVAGDLMAMRALSVASCANQSECPIIQLCPLDFLFTQE